jgi:hypothetical protein
MNSMSHPYSYTYPYTLPLQKTMPQQQKIKPEMRHETVVVQAANILLSVSPKFGPMKPPPSPPPLELLTDFANPSPLDLLANFALNCEYDQPMSSNLRALNLEMHSPTTTQHSLEQYKDIYNKNGRIGIYTRKERDAIIARFRDKRTRRVWSKKIRYGCRKNLADRRIRIKGRFVRADEQQAMNFATGGYEKPPKGRRSTM